MKRNLEAQYKELEEKRRVFEDEKANWEAQQRILEQQKLDASKSVTLPPTASLNPLIIDQGWAHSSPGATPPRPVEPFNRADTELPKYIIIMMDPACKLPVSI